MINPAVDHSATPAIAKLSDDERAKFVSEISGRPVTPFSTPICDLLWVMFKTDPTEASGFPTREILAAVYGYCYDTILDLTDRHIFPELVGDGFGGCPRCWHGQDVPECVEECIDQNVNEKQDLSRLRSLLEAWHDMKSHPARVAVWELVTRLVGYHLLVVQVYRNSVGETIPSPRPGGPPVHHSREDLRVDGADNTPHVVETFNVYYQCFMKTVWQIDGLKMESRLKSAHAST